MADMNRNDIVRLGIDLYHNRVSGNYSIDQANEVLNKALVELNGGNTRLDMRDIRAGRCNELFAVIEEVIMDVKNDIIANDPFFSTFVDYRNVAWGDKPEFYLPDEDLFIVSSIGGGSQAIRRQRVVGAGGDDGFSGCKQLSDFLGTVHDSLFSFFMCFMCLSQDSSTITI